ncbi:hypothetical protein OH77DRAFT_931588 [Trametes cingulata]|nr:hypothetical protein OH77DRAFT_931588 [Trametes cingulata]
MLLAFGGGACRRWWASVGCFEQHRASTQASPTLAMTGHISPDSSVQRHSPSGPRQCHSMQSSQLPQLVYQTSARNSAVTHMGAAKEPVGDTPELSLCLLSPP